VDLVLATHLHGDHFDPEPVGRHLLANRSADFVSSVQAVELLRRDFSSYPEIAARVRGVFPEEGRLLSMKAGGIELQALNLHHGRDRQPPVENLGFLIRLGGFRVLHLGDTQVSAEELARYRLESQDIDLAFVPFWYLLAAEHVAIILDHVAADTVVAMHLPAPDAPARYFGPEGSLDELIRGIEASLPGTVVLREVGETRVFEGATVDAEVGN
jgi:L-ascorbate metabolism protein UlaG (beta-lactamase superfamily)